jgi:ketosteroid isomerase-like protein
MSGEAELVERIYGFNWASVGDRRAGFEELEAVVGPDFESRTSPDLGGRVLCGVGGLVDLSEALEADFEQLNYEPGEFLEVRDGVVLVCGTVFGVGRTSGMPLSGEFAHLWTIRDGLARHCEAYRDVSAARSAAGLG